MELAASICGVTLPIIGPDETGDGICFEHIEIANLPRQFGLLDKACGEASFRYIESAVEITSALPSSCIVTAPINKEALNAAGHYYDGHTGMLVHLTKSKSPWMLLESEKLPVVHVFTHVPLRDAIERATIERVLETIRTGHKYLKRMGVENPRIVVAGINPHCGKNGLFRTGDDERLLPAVEAAQAEGINFVWPISADTCITVHIRVHLICSLRNITIRAHPDQTRHF